MSIATRDGVAQTTRHGTVSFVAGFLAGLALFLAVGATPADAVFSAVAAATLVAVRRSFPE